MGSRAHGRGLAFDGKKDTSSKGKGVTLDNTDAETGPSPFGGRKKNVIHTMSLLLPAGCERYLHGLRRAGGRGGECA